MWANLLSGGHATYGGFHTYEAHATSDHGKDTADVRGIQGYYDGNIRLSGGDDFVHIQRFFKDTRITLAGLVPDDDFPGGDPSRIKCIRDEKVSLIYLANPDHPSPEKATASEDIPQVEVLLPGATARWFNPSTGKWYRKFRLGKGSHKLIAPSGGDWVLLLR
jgi:hypothetical protein